MLGRAAKRLAFGAAVAILLAIVWSLGALLLLWDLIDSLRRGRRRACISS
jgi:hypothetical protein